MANSEFQHERLRALYEKSGKTYESISFDSDVPIKNLWRYLSGAADPSTGAIVGLARCFNVSTDYLLGTADDPRPLAIASKLTTKELDLLAAYRLHDVYAVLQLVIDNRPA